MNRKTPNRERMMEILDYDPSSGNFTWKIRIAQKAKIGQLAGNVNDTGYVRIRVDGERYLAHRLAWLFLTGKNPPDQIDHINRIRSDNRACNLRLASSKLNKENTGLRKNNTSGTKGVSRQGNGWRARITHNNLEIHIGSYSKLEDAITARKDAECKYHIYRS